MTETADAKAALRASLLAARRELSAEDIEAARGAIRVWVMTSALARSWTSVAAYVPMRTEPSGEETLDELARAGIRVIVPELLPDRDLDWVSWRGPDGRLGVDAVASVDAVLVPALAVARDGTRLGRGGGSYDRALARVPVGVPRVALVYAHETASALPADEWDQRVTAVITPAGWFDLPRT